ncbi:MAG: ATP-binding protein [Planctomycetes bacterium]|nr:ATP-binding protein [Planctomycetota bacterium]
MIERPLYTAAWDELSAEKAMVFIAGPRQVGKTTLAEAIGRAFPNRLHLNWDVESDRARILKAPYFFAEMPRRDASPPLVVFDEIHKRRGWKAYLKGVYDRFGREFRFLVTGSGRLDTYQRGGDSLAGRYLLFHLWPFTLAELAGRRVSIDSFRADPLGVIAGDLGSLEKTWRRLASSSCFPEPYVAARPASYRRWSSTYSSQIVREDIRDLTGIRAIGDLETLFVLLPERVGSPLSITSLAEDLEVAYNTVRSWLDAFERFYLVFTITPWTRRVVRAIHKERKTYLFDHALIEDPAPRFENMVALELFRAVELWSDLGHGRFSLHYVKNKEQDEVDFLIADGRRPILLVEAKRADPQVSRALRKFQDQLGVPAVQLLDEGDSFRTVPNGAKTILVAPAWMWLPRLP